MPEWLPSALTWFVSTALGGAAVWGAIKGQLENHAQRIKTLEQEVGTRDTGLRGAVHKHEGQILLLDDRLSNVEHMVKKR